MSTVHEDLLCLYIQMKEGSLKNANLKSWPKRTKSWSGHTLYGYLKSQDMCNGTMLIGNLQNTWWWKCEWTWFTKYLYEMTTVYFINMHNCIITKSKRNVIKILEESPAVVLIGHICWSQMKESMLQINSH